MTGFEKHDEPQGWTSFHYKLCSVCGIEMFCRRDSYPICNNCFAHRDDKPC
jgi:hypothetical protein